MVKITQYPRNADGTPMKFFVGVLTDTNGNNGARLMNVPKGPDNNPIDSVAIVLIDNTGTPVPIPPGGIVAGASAYERAVANGFVGTEAQWLASLASTVQGPAGPAGLLYGTVDPSDGMGIDGNFYINYATWYVFGPKLGGHWPAGVSMIGSSAGSTPPPPPPPPPPPASPIAAPILSNPTTTGEWDTQYPDNTDIVGDTEHLLIFSDSGLTAQVQHLVKMITPDEMAGDPADWSVNAVPPPRDAATGVITGKAMGVGQRWWYMYIERDDGTVSPNSNVVTAVIAATVGNLPNLKVWLDPSDLSTMFQTGTRGAPGTAVAADGDPVGLILDKSGNQNDFVQATAGKRPLYKTSAGKSWLQFDEVDDNLESASQNIGCATAIMAAKIHTASPAWAGFLGQKAGQGGSTVQYAWLREAGNNNFYSRDSDAASLANNTHFWRNKVNQDKNFTPNTVEVYSADGTGRAAGAITFGGTETVLGAVPASGSNISGIDVYGLILAGGSDAQILSSTDRNVAEDYLATKSGAY